MFLKEKKSATELCKVSKVKGLHAPIFLTIIVYYQMRIKKKTFQTKEILT